MGPVIPRQRRGCFSFLEWEVLSRHEFATTAAQAVVLDWYCGFYLHDIGATVFLFGL